MHFSVNTHFQADLMAYEPLGVVGTEDETAGLLPEI